MKLAVKYIAAFLLAALSLIPVGAQTVTETAGVMFLEILTDARSAAMGGMADLCRPAVMSVFYNPAACVHSDARFAAGATLSARKDFSTNNLYSISGYYKMNERNILLAGIRHFGYPVIKWLDGSGVEISETRPQEAAIDMAYGRSLSDRLSVAITARYIISNLIDDKIYNGNAMAADIGINYSAPLGERPGAHWSLGLAASNLGTKISYTGSDGIAGTKYTLPAAVKAGTAFHLPFSDNHSVNATANFGYRMLPASFAAFEAGIGAEYCLYQTGFLRAGYHLSGKEKGPGSFPTLGAGVAWKFLRFDISYWAGVPEQDYKNIVFVSLGSHF